MLNETFTTPAADADLTAYNDAFAAAHPHSAPHLLAVYAARHALDPNSRSANEADVIKTLDLPDITVEQATRGMELLEKWGSEEGVKEEFGRKAGGRWSGFGQ